VARKTEQEQQHKNEENHSLDSGTGGSQSKILSCYGEQRDYQEPHGHSQHYNNSCSLLALYLSRRAEIHRDVQRLSAFLRAAYHPCRPVFPSVLPFKRAATPIGSSRFNPP
jgi:hypothetical protein